MSAPESGSAGPRGNRLGVARSPYLRAHRDNPVAWWEWGDAAFEAARRDDKPVLISVGYSACHWCHVMAHESFEDPEIAAYLNEHFVSVKVDREERPDVDAAYQRAHQAISQRRGGWPLTMFAGPDRRPFFGGTYFGPRGDRGAPTFRAVLEAVVAGWKTEREALAAHADELSAFVTESLSARTASAGGVSADSLLGEAVGALVAQHDATHGGFGKAPKFPNYVSLGLLDRAAALGLPGVAEAARAARDTTLAAMARGGIRDHLGGGFARYSTDAVWKVPHFEKMLYDNALALGAYTDAWRGAHLAGPETALSGPTCRAVCEALVGWLEREMLSPDGSFYAAQDADSEGEEGRFFVWSYEALRGALGDDADAFALAYDVRPEGNWEPGRSVLWQPRPMVEIAAQLGTSLHNLEATLARCRGALFAVRARRPPPATDDKSIAGWNGLTIAALARASAAFGRPDWGALAATALSVWRRDFEARGALVHLRYDGASVASPGGFLDDHAAMALGAFAVAEAGLDGSAFAFARALCDALLERFVDAASGRLQHTARGAETVLAPSFDLSDPATPGGVGLGLAALARASLLFDHPGARAFVDAQHGAYAAAARGHGHDRAALLDAVDGVARGASVVVLLGDPAHPDHRALTAALEETPLAHRVTVLARDADAALALGIAAHWLEGRAPGVDGAPVLWLCRDAVCERPVTTAAAWRALHCAR
ncbi:MAG: thioredoxin domain-containing protein [Myxococcales bacterium]|nr:thioredoxin domain-containing protein [Myxococcales bacterium]